jgi:uncharacterized phage protein gp47/JayE
MATPNETSARLVRALQVSEPDLDVGVGTPLRKILDTVAEAISEVSVDSFLTTYQYDIDTRAGADLDAFAALFGFYRIVAKKAHGSILLQRTTPAPASVLVSAGSQAGTNTSPPVLVQTLVPSVFPRSGVTLEVPVQAVEGGSRGNVAAGSITRWMTSVEGVTSITNPAPLVGGTDVESDEQFRQRLKNTIFRNMAGTKDMYRAVGLSQESTTTCEVYGAYDRWVERIEIVGGVGSPSIATPPGTRSITGFTSTNASPSRVGGVTHELNVGDYVFISGIVGNTNVNGLRRVRWVDDWNYMYLEDIDGNPINGNGVHSGTGVIYPISRMTSARVTGYALGNDIDLGDVFQPSMYSVNFAVTPPVVTVIDATAIPDGVYDFSFTYTSQASRNFPHRTTNIIADNVDIWVDGETVETANVVTTLDSRNTMDEQSTLWPSGAYRLRNGYRPNRRGTSRVPIFLPLPLSPVVSVPSSITIGSGTYLLGTHYFIADRIDRPLVGSMEARSGIMFEMGTTSGLGNIPASLAISSSTNATPVVLSMTSTHDFLVGQRIRVTGNSQAALNADWYVQAVTSNTITLQDSTAPGGSGTGGMAHLFHPVSLDYTFNRAPLDVQRSTEEWRLAGTNVLTHKAVPLPLKFFVAVILRNGYSVSSLQTTIEYAVSSVLSAAGIGGVVQISDVLNAISDIAGVDAVRMMAGGDRTSKTITNVVNAGDDSTVTTSTPHGFNPGDMVQVSGVLGATAANGVWEVRSVGSATEFNGEHMGTGGSYTSGGTVRSANYAVQIMSLDGTRPVFLVADLTQTPPRPIDIHANQTEHFVLHSVDISVKAQNSWGVN